MYTNCYLSITAFLVLVPITAVLGQSPGELCQPFYNVLKELPSKELTYSPTPYTSISNGQEYEGCEIRFITSDPVVMDHFQFLSLWIDKDSRIYQQGWRINDRYTADELNSMVFGLEKLDKLCIILENQQATLEEPDKIVQNETLKVVVQCRQTETRQRKVFVTAIPADKQDSIQWDSADWNSTVDVLAVPVRTDATGDSRSETAAQVKDFQQHPKSSPALEIDPDGDTCEYFYEQLKDVPHEQLDRKSGKITFSWDRKKYSGCSIRFVTNDSLRTEKHKLPSLWPKSNAHLYRNGWRNNYNYTADGPGTSAFGIEKDNTLCLIYRARPATLVEPDKIVQAEKTTLTVECIEKKIK